MKTPIVTFLLVILFLFANTEIYAYDFQYDGINYNIISAENRTVEVSEGYYSGAFEIPSKTIYQSKTYSVIAIGANAFFKCYAGISSVSMPNSITTIGNGAFRNLPNLTSINIPNSVTSIGRDVFDQCYGLTSINVDDANKKYCSIDGVLYSKDTDTLICCPARDTFTIPGHVKTIGTNAFSSCNRESLMSVNIGDAVVTIDSGAFFGCNALTTLSIPGSVNTIGNGAFGNCGFSSVTINDGVSTIGDGAFNLCFRLTSISIPNSVTSIGEYAFKDCRELTDIALSSAITTINKETFYNCCNLGTVTIPNSVNTIEEYAFCGCNNLSTIDIPNSVSIIGNSAFDCCSKLSSVTIGKGITTIGTSAFRYCDDITTVYCKANIPPTAPGNLFEYETLKGTLYIPTDCKAAYEAVDPWRNFWNIEEMEFSGIDAVSTDKDELQISVVDGSINVSGISDHDHIFVYSVNGHLVYSGIDRNITNLPKGIYIIKAGNSTAKISI